MKVEIVEFPETRVAAIEHHGAPELEYDTVRKLIAWRVASGLSLQKHRSYGVHYTNPRTAAPGEHRADFCVSFDDEIRPNPHGIAVKVIPANRCARARHLGSRAYNSAAVYLGETWFPASGETLGNFPIFFHYANVGPGVLEADMVTDVYLPLQRKSV